MNDKQKLQEFQKLTGLDVTTIGQQTKQEADELGLESKEVETKEESVATVSEPNTTETVVTEPEPTPSLTPELIGEAMRQAIRPLVERIEAMEKSLSEKPESETKEETPLDRVMSAYKSRVVGNEEARVDGRTKEAKDAPAENADGQRVKVDGSSIPAQVINYAWSGQLARDLGVQQ